MTARDLDPDRARRRRRAFAELEADPRFDRFRRRRGRRLLLAAHLGWGALGYVGFGQLTEAAVGPGVVVGAGLAWLAGFVVLTGWLNAAVGGVTELPYAVLDEAQTAVRRRAEADAHRAVRAVLFLVGLAAIGSLGARYGMLVGAGDATRDVTGGTTLTLALSLEGAWWTWTLIGVAAACSLLAILPLYLLAWRLPDDVVEPEPLESAA